MTSSWLFCTTVPVLLDGRTLAGRVAKDIYLRHRLTSEWFGSGFSPNLMAYTKRHDLDLSVLKDPWLVRLLKDFAESPAMKGNLTVLIPCSPRAGLFVARCAAALESSYVILPYPTRRQDPLAPLVRSDTPITPDRR